MKQFVVSLDFKLGTTATVTSGNSPIQDIDNGSIVFEFELFNDKEPFDILEGDTVQLIVRTPEKALIVSDVDELMLVLPQGMKANNGLYTGQLIVSRGGSVAVTNKFTYQVSRSLAGDSVVEATDFHSRLVQLNNDFAELQNTVDNFFDDNDILIGLLERIDLIEQDIASISEDISNLQEGKLDVFELEWTNAVLENGWTSNAGTVIQYAKDPFGFVYIRGWMANGVNGTKVFTLPVGFRPSQPTRLPTAYSGYVRINANGDVIQEAGSTVSSPLDSIRFMSAQ